jgi:Arc/MetJ-type ribon-helix-helix transcriptional regulator
MAITLRPETERLLEEQLKSGAYDSVDEVVYAALNALGALGEIQLGNDRELLDGIDRAEAQIERGDVHEWDAVKDRLRGEFLGRQP